MWIIIGIIITLIYGLAWSLFDLSGQYSRAEEALEAQRGEGKDAKRAG